MKIDRFTNAKSRSNPLMRWIAAKLVRYLQSTPFMYGNSPDDITIGRNVSLANVILNARSGKIRIGDNVIFGHNCMVLAGAHALVPEDGKRPTDQSGRDIIIGSNVFIASGAIITGPCLIGDNSVVAAGAVVVDDVPNNVMVAGVPAKIVRSLP